MLLLDLIKKIFRKVGLETYRFRPWMELSSLLHYYKIKTVVDVGANVGQFALEICEHNSNIKIHSFEPIKSVFSELQKNTINYSNVICYNYGLGDNETQLEINVNEASPSSSILELADVHKRNFEFATQTQKEIIKISTLDLFFEKEHLEKPILLKIDVQGYEDKVLQGAKVFLTQVDFLFIEASFHEMYKGQMLFGDLFNLIIKAGFEFVGIVEHKYDVNTHELLFGNAIFKKIKQN